MSPITATDSCASCRSRYCERLPDPGRTGCIGVIALCEPVSSDCPMLLRNANDVEHCLMGLRRRDIEELLYAVQRYNRNSCTAQGLQYWRDSIKVARYLGSLLRDGRIAMMGQRPFTPVLPHLVRKPAGVMLPKKQMLPDLPEMPEQAPPPASAPPPAPKKTLQAHVVEVPDVLFFHNGRLPCLDREGRLIRALSTTLQYAQTTDTLEELVVFGHADRSGEHAVNYKVSEHRAKAVKSLLDVDDYTWKEIAGEHGQVQEYQGILSVLTECHGWACDPGKVDNDYGSKTEAGVRAFQEQANARYGLQLSVDGVVGPKTWKAIHRVLCGLVAKSMGVVDPAQPDYPGWSFPEYGYSQGKGCYGCGESLPVDQGDKDGARNQKNRRVELVFFAQGQAELRPPSNRNAQLTKEDCVLMDADKLERKRVEPYPMPWDRITIGDMFWEFFQKNMFHLDDGEKFHAMLQRVYGEEVTRDLSDKLYNDFASAGVTAPKFQVSKTMDVQQLGAYSEETIYLNRQLVVDANAHPLSRWLLLMVMVHEAGHYIDDLIRYKYSQMGGDSAGEEGTKLARYYMTQEDLRLFKEDFKFADVSYQNVKETRTLDLTLTGEDLDKEGRARSYWRYDQAIGDENGQLKDESGRMIEVEFWSINIILTGVHEQISKEAAIAACYIIPATKSGTPNKESNTTSHRQLAEHQRNENMYAWDAHLYRGCAWPDVPNEEHPDEPSSDYGNFIWMEVRDFLGIKHQLHDNIAYKSHYGENQHWHSMCPRIVIDEDKVEKEGSGKHFALADGKKAYVFKDKGDWVMRLSNEDVKEKILAQLEEWYANAIKFRNQGKPGYGLVNIGKMLHTIQDSYCHSHCWRRYVGDENKNEFWSINEQLLENGERPSAILPDDHGTIWLFQGYDKQQASIPDNLHKQADMCLASGYGNAVKASEKILRLYKAGDGWDSVKKYLDEVVYRLHPGRDELDAGASHPWFKKRMAEGEASEKAIRDDEEELRSEERIYDMLQELRAQIEIYDGSQNEQQSAGTEWKKQDAYGDHVCVY